jgi:hypothetical protein
LDECVAELTKGVGRRVRLRVTRLVMRLRLFLVVRSRSWIRHGGRESGNGKSLECLLCSCVLVLTLVVSCSFSLFWNFKFIGII